MSMWRSRLLLVPLLTFLVAATPGEEGAPGEADAANLEHNRQLLQKWKADPEHYARLQRDLRDFWALPKAKRQQLRRLDSAFHQLDGKTQKRLWRTAERYAAWLERLPDDERRQIEETKDTQERLQLIRTIRERQWIEHLPRKVREDLEKLPDQERSAKMAVLRKQERQQRQHWSRPLPPGPRPGQPLRTADLSPQAKDFLIKQLLPHLNADEKRKYQQAEGRPEFARTLKELARHHPVLPPLHNKPVARWEDLPDKAKVVAGSKPNWERRTDVWERLHRVEGKWPEWAMAFHAQLSKQQREQMPPLGASRPIEFPRPVPNFIRNSLPQKITAQEANELRKRLGKWPDYPLFLLQLAEKHKFELPGMTLPGSAEW